MTCPVHEIYRGRYNHVCHNVVYYTLDQLLNRGKPLTPANQGAIQEKGERV